MLTVAEYRALGPFRRWGLRLVRHPIILFGLVPFYLFVIQQLPLGLVQRGWRPWASALGINAMLVVILTLLASAFGLSVTAVAMLPTLVMTASIGVWLFFVQHYFGASQFRRAQDWSFAEAALHGIVCRSR